MVLKLKCPVIIRNSSDTYDFMYAVINGKDILEENIHFDMAKEHFWAIALNRLDKTVNFELVAMGSDCQAVVDPVEVYGIPVYKRAAGVILVHNHPSGTLQASEADKDLTDNLIQAGIILKRPVRDHVIITEHSYYSFKDNGLLFRLQQSKKYLPYYELEKRFDKDMDREIRRIKKEEKEKIKASKEEGKIKGVEIGRREVAKNLREMDREIRKIKKEEQKKIKVSREEGIEKGRKEEKIQIAVSMRANGYKKDEIAKLTGLSISDTMNL